MNQHTTYLFHPQLEIFRCGGGVLMCYILGNKISLFEESLDDNFSSFILKSIKINKPFSVADMINYFSKTGKKYNFGKILSKLEKNGLVNEAHDKVKTIQKKILFVNLADISDQHILEIYKEFLPESSLKLINGLQLEKNDKSLYKKLEKIQDNEIVFVMSDFQHKHKVSELNLHFFKKGVFWCPIIIDAFGGYIGPLIHSDPSGPCFSCYDKRIYTPTSALEDKITKPSALLNIFLRVSLLELLKIETNISPSQLIYSNLLEIDCWNHRSRKHYIYSDSDCPVCGI